MSGSVELSADWAVWSKEPGTRQDYSVLAASIGTFSHADFAAIFSRFSPGTPLIQPPGDSAPRQPEVSELPWVTLSWVSIDNQPYIGLAIQQATSLLDGVGRQITRTSYYCVSYTEFAVAPLSYADLYEQAVKLTLPEQDGPPTTLELPVVDAEAVARRIGSIGERTASLVADRLLRGPVSIVKADGSTLVDRLRFLDAVAWMLPYGYRARFTASTWSDSGERHRIRLAFAERKQASAEVYTWRSGEPDRALADPGGYLAQFDRLRGRSADSLKQYDLTFIVGHLADDTAPQRFDDPRYAIRSLRSIDLPFAILAAVRGGQPNRPEVRELFANRRVLELPADGQLEVFMVPVSSTEPDDWAAVRQWWPELGTPSTAALIPALTTACRSLLWRASPDLTELNARVDLTVKKGLADSLLSRLIEQPDSVALGRGLSAAGQLLCTWMADKSRPGDFPLTLAALPGNPALACELAALIALSPNRGKGQRLDDLRRAMPRLMAPFAELSGKTTHPVSIDTIAMLADARLSCPVALLRVADDAQRLRHVLPGFTEWISTRANLNPPGYTYFAGELEKLTVRHADEAADADLALLAAGGMMKFIKTCDAYELARKVYIDRFPAQWNHFIQYNGSQRGDPFALAFQRWLDDGQWAENETTAYMVTEICRRLVPRDRRPKFCDLVTSILRYHPDASRWQFAVDWDREFYKPRLVASGAQGSLTRLPAASAPTQIVAACYRAYLQNVAAKAAGLALARAEVLTRAPNADDVLDAVWSAFRADLPETGRSLWRRLMIPFGSSGEHELRGWFDDVIKFAAGAIRRRTGKLTVTALPGPQGGNRS